MQLQKILIYSLTNKRAVKPPKIFHNQILANLQHIADLSEGKNLQQPDMFVFKHMLSKLKEDSEFTPLGDISNPIIKVTYFIINCESASTKDLLKELEEAQQKKDLIFSPTFRIDSDFTELYSRLLKEKLSVKTLLFANSNSFALLPALGDI